MMFVKERRSGSFENNVRPREMLRSQHCLGGDGGRRVQGFPELVIEGREGDKALPGNP